MQGELKLVMGNCGTQSVAKITRDRVATPAGWYSAFREATWEEALSLAAQQILRIRDEHGPRALGALSRIMEGAVT